jgi:hypothetical protein
MSSFDWRKPVSVLPFGYYAVTRLPGWRDLVSLVATTWLPAIWILHRLGGLSLPDAALTFVAGYIAFLGIYEIGYLVNDSWDTARSTNSRRRVPFATGPLYAAILVAVHLAAWLAIGRATGWIANPAWFGGFAVLAVAFAQHNLVTANWVRIASFYQLATLRFILPVIGAIPAGHYATVLVAALLFYTYVRYLSYADSKDLLAMPERREARFNFLQCASLAPLALLAALLLRAGVFVELLGYFLAAYALWWGLTARRASAHG